MKSSAWLIIVTILRPYDGYTWNTHQLLDSAFVHEEKITLEIPGISHDIFSRSQTVFSDSEVPVTVAAEEILRPMVCVGVEDFAEKSVTTVLGRVSRGGDDAGEESNWSAGRTCWSFLGLEPSCAGTLGITPLAIDTRASTNSLPPSVASST